MNTEVSIIILNWNRWKDTIECLESLYQINYIRYNVILVDNGSGDESLQKIREYCKGQIEVKSNFFKYKTENKPIKIFEYTENNYKRFEIDKNKLKNLNSDEKLIIIKNNKNYGFAKGNNIAINFAQDKLNCDYLLLLNNDTVVDKLFLNELINFARKDEKIGIVGAKVYYYNEPEKIHSAGGFINFYRGETIHFGYGKLDRGQYNLIKNVNYVEGSCFLISKSLIEKIGNFNSSYFLNWEETDFCMRAKEAGYKIVYVPNAKIWHKISSSSVSSTSEYFFTRNMFWFMKKFAKKEQYLMFILYFFGYKFWLRTGTLILYYKSFNGLSSFLKGTFEGIRMLS